MRGCWGRLRLLQGQGQPWQASGGVSSSNLQLLEQQVQLLLLLVLLELLVWRDDLLVLLLPLLLRHSDSSGPLCGIGSECWDTCSCRCGQ